MPLSPDTSYATIADATVYHADRGNDAWINASPVEQSSALIRATDYIDTTYRAHGDSLDPAQPLQWPREGQTGVDRRVQRATMILAAEALTGPLQARSERGIKELKQALDGVGSTETVYDDAAPADPYPHVTSLLSDIATLRSDHQPGVWVGRVAK